MIYITGDMHGEPERLKSEAVKKLKKTDTLIVCGDFGFIWDGSQKEEAMLKKIGKMKPQILFVPGCHDNYDLLSRYPEVDFCGGRARQISGRLYELLRGQIYTIDGKKIFAFGGGISEDMLLREEGVSWWRQEMPDDDEYQAAIAALNEQDNTVDYIVTHDVSTSIRQFLKMEQENVEIGKIHAFFNVIGKNVRFTAWFFGKYHLDKTIPPRYYALFQSVIRAPGQDSDSKKRKKGNPEKNSEKTSSQDKTH